VRVPPIVGVAAVCYLVAGAIVAWLCVQYKRGPRRGRRKPLPRAKVVRRG
jgi:hypothetical protein